VEAVKVGSATAGRWILGMIIYFFIFITVVTYVSNADSNVSYSGDGFANNGAGVLQTGVCGSPRYAYNSDGSSREVFGSSERITDCWSTQGFIEADTCNSIEGCSWEEASSVYCLFFKCSDNNTICNGEVNLTEYDSNETDLIDKGSLCSISGLQGDKETCEAVGCTYYAELTPELELSLYKSQKTLLSTIADMITFNADIGLPAGYNYMFSFLFFYLPFFILSMAVFMYARG